MIKTYTMEVIGVDSDDHRTLFTLRAFDEACAKLTPFWCAASPGLQAGDRRLSFMLELLQIVVHTMPYECRATRLQISVLPRCGTGEHPGPHVRLRPICVQLGFAAAHRCVLRTSAAHGLRGNLQAAHGAKAGTRQALAVGMQQRRVAAIPQQSGH